MGKWKEGELVILYHESGKSFLFPLEKGKILNTHLGSVSHEEIMRKEEGEEVITTQGIPLRIFRPTLWDFIFEMKRLSGIIYPKDAGYILLWGDIFPGAVVIEGGIGSGAMLLVLSRTVGEKGRLISYDEREDMIEVAKENLLRFYGKIPPHVELKKGNIYEGFEEEDGEVDRIILDVPEPWRVLPHAERVLRGGGILITYLPTILQVAQFHSEAEKFSFTSPETVEVLVRPWHIKGHSVRPQHRMIAHTGFLTKIRKCLP